MANPKLHISKKVILRILVLECTLLVGRVLGEEVCRGTRLSYIVVGGSIRLEELQIELV